MEIDKIEHSCEPEKLHDIVKLEREKSEINLCNLNEWENTKYFNNEWLFKINEHQRNLISTDIIQNPKV